MAESRVKNRGKGPERLINIDTMSVEDVRSLGLRYFALSYVWGNASRLQPADQSTRIRCGNRVVAAHRVIRDAIELTKELGEKYLWVDSFCIPQDNPSERASEIATMNHVYAGALMTIVALASDDADSGLEGVRTYSTNRRPRVERLDGIRLTVVQPTASAVASGPSCKWNQRAWTMQEQLFSRRILYIGPRQAYFSCMTAAWCEDRYEGTDNNLELREHPGKFLLERPHEAAWWNVWQAYVEQYSARLSTFQDDRYYAFQGILNQQKESWNIDTTFALPLKCLPLALYWFHGSVPYENLTTTRHRIDNFPSWSWVGWSAQVNFPNYLFYRSVIRQVIIKSGNRDTTHLYDGQGREQQIGQSRERGYNTFAQPDIQSAEESADRSKSGRLAERVRLQKQRDKLALSFETLVVTVIAVVPRSNRSKLIVKSRQGVQTGTLHSAAFVSSFDLAVGELELACTCILMGTSPRPFFWKFNDTFQPTDNPIAGLDKSTLGVGKSHAASNLNVMDAANIESIGPLIPQQHDRWWHTRGTLSFIPVGVIVLVIVAAYYTLILACVLVMWPIVLLLALVLVHPLMYVLGYERVAHVIWVEDLDGDFYERRGVGELQYRAFKQLKPEMKVIKLI